jgi:hypothetical protein
MGIKGAVRVDGNFALFWFAIYPICMNSMAVLCSILLYLYY